MPLQRLVVCRQQQRFKSEEDSVIHNSTVTIHTGHMHLETDDHSDKDQRKTYQRLRTLCRNIKMTDKKQTQNFNQSLPGLGGNSVKELQNEPGWSTGMD